jgi:hypothetical protein
MEVWELQPQLDKWERERDSEKEKKTSDDDISWFTGTLAMNRSGRAGIVWRGGHRRKDWTTIRHYEQAIQDEEGVMWHVNPLLGKELLNELPWRQALDKQLVFKLRNNGMVLSNPFLSNGTVNRGT